MSDSAAEAAETSKAGALRMRRLARLTPLIPPATSAVHRPSGQIIYRALPPSLTPTHFISSFTPHAQPRPLALPPYLGPGKELSISPSGEWVVIFHPAPSTINQTSEGGTLAIYSSAILSPLALPGNVVPLATFPLPSDVLAIQHIYGMSPGRGDGEDGAMAGSTGNEQQSDTEPPKPEQEGGNLAGVSGSAGSKRISPPTYGPHPPSTYSPTQGPAFLVLTSTGIILFHPQVLPPPPGTLSAGVEYEPQYAYNTLKCPLHTRWYATSGGMAPPDIGRVDRGWAGIVRGDEGVWFAYEDTEVFGLLRAEVVIKDGKASLLTTRMPPLPVPSQSIRRVQGVMFASVPKHALPAESRPSMRRDGSGGGEDVDMEAGAEAGDAGDRDKVDRVGEKDGALVGVVVASRTTTPATETTPVHVQTHVATYAVQRCEVDIVDAFREINGSVGEKNEAPAAWDWYALPSALSDNPLPPNTLILALAPLYPLLHPRAVALLANPPDAAPTLVHLDLCPPPSSAGTAVDTTDATSGIVIAIGDKGTPIDPELILGISAPCMLSPAAEEGYVGQVGVLDPRKGPVFYAMPAIAGGARTRGMGDGEGGDGEVAGLRGEERLTIVQAIITAALRGEGYADVLGALFVQTPKNRLSDMLLRTLTDCYTAFRRHPRVEENVELARLQVALFSQSADPRQGLAATVCRLLAAVVLFDRCAVETEQGIDFELVAEYIISTLASTLRTAVLYQGRTAWSSQQSSQQSSQVQPIPADLILILHPTFRSLLLRLLAQIRTFKSFVQSLEKPILQPESRYAPAPSVRDPRATIVARERVGDIGMKDGVDIMLWGRGLVLADKRVREIEEGETEEARLARREKEDMAIFELNPDLLGDGAKGVLNGLPCPSEILLAPSGTEEGHAGVDGITFLPLGDMADLDDTPTHSQQNINGHSVNGSTVANPGANPRERRVRCNTCGSRTEALGWTRGQGMNMGVFGTRYASGLGSSVGWNGWRAAREKGCVCGGAWTR